LALLVHINANSVSNAIFEPVKNLNYAALPFRMLAPVRMLVEGVVYPAGIALSGGALLWMQSAFAPQVVLGVALVLSVLFAAASGLVGLSFLPSLLRSLRLRAVSPSEYSNCEPGRRFSQSDIRYLLLHPDEEARRFGRDLARRLAPHLLRAEGHGRSSIWAAAATAIGELAHGFSPEWSAAPGLLLSNGNGSVRFDVGRVESGRWCAVRTGAGFGIRHRTGQRRDTTSELADLGRGLEHAGSGVRRTAAWLLARNGDAAVSTAAERLHSSRPEVVEAAIQALGAIRTRKAQRVLRDYLRPLYQQARLNLAALQHLTAGGLPESARNDLAEGLADSNRRIVRKVLAVKSALGNRRDINLLLSLTQTKEPRVRSDAVEALTSLPTGRLIRPVLPLLNVQQGSSAGNVTLTGSDRANAADPAVAVWRAAADDRWLRLLAARLFGHRDQETPPAGDDMMLDLILFLNSVPLFRAASFEDIARIAEKTQTVAVAKGEALFSEGESVTHIYVVRSGSIELSRDGSVVEIMQAGTSMGEHAVIGDTHHEVSARAASESLLLRFPAQLFADLVAEHPESLGPVVGDLVRRVNMLHGRLAETRGSPQSAAAHRFGSSGRAGGRAPIGRMAMA
jgi:CRP-like cAMP-binding protein/HEAT repeat protein